MDAVTVQGRRDGPSPWDHFGERPYPRDGPEVSGPLGPSLSALLGLDTAWWGPAGQPEGHCRPVGVETEGPWALVSVGPGLGSRGTPGGV